MEFSNITELHNFFAAGKLSELPDSMTVNGLKFNFLKGTEYPITDMINKNLKGIVLYSLEKTPENIDEFKQLHKNADESEIQERIALIWAFNRLRLHPVSVKFISKARSEPLVSTGIVRETNINDDRIIGYIIPIILSGFNDGTQMDAKVDTGAHICSLHADNIEMKNGQGMVSFTFGDRRYTMPTIETQAVQTADSGIENRPVVVFDVVLPNNDADTKNRIVKKVKFNLNDRGDMPDKILLGQNFIKSGDFVVMDSDESDEINSSDESDEINWEEFQEQFSEIEYQENVDNDSTLEDIHSILDQTVQNILTKYKK